MTQRRVVHRMRVTYLAMLAAVIALGACASPAASPTAKPASPPTSAPAAKAAAPTAVPATVAAKAEPAAKTQASSVASTFQGKTIELLVGYAPGGGFDTYARIWAQHASKHIPGNPDVKVENKPGADSLLAIQDVMRRRPDGMSMVVIPEHMVVKELLGEDLPGYDWKQATYLGKPDAVNAWGGYFVRTEVARSWDDVKKLGRPVTNGEPGPGATGSQPMLWLELAGAPIKNVYGYGGGTEIMAAVNRKELDGSIRGAPGMVLKSFPEWIETRPPFVTPVVRWRGPIEQEWLDRGGWQQPPDILEAVQSTPAQRQALELYLEYSKGSRIIALPAGVPADIVAALKQALADTVRDPAFVQAMKEREYDVGLQTGEEYLATAAKLQAAPPEAADVLRKMYGMTQ